MSLEALRGVSRAFDEHLHRARRQIGQIEVAAQVRELIAGSTLIDATDRVQDAYSLRAAPQVLGAVKDSLAHVRSIVERELNAATDNPLIFLDLARREQSAVGRQLPRRTARAGAGFPVDRGGGDRVDQRTAHRAAAGR